MYVCWGDIFRRRPKIFVIFSLFPHSIWKYLHVSHVCKAKDWLEVKKTARTYTHTHTLGGSSNCRCIETTSRCRKCSLHRALDAGRHIFRHRAALIIALNKLWKKRLKKYPKKNSRLFFVVFLTVHTRSSPPSSKQRMQFFFATTKGEAEKNSFRSGKKWRGKKIIKKVHWRKVACFGVHKN